MKPNTVLRLAICLVVGVMTFLSVSACAGTPIPIPIPPTETPALTATPRPTETFPPTATPRPTETFPPTVIVTIQTPIVRPTVMWTPTPSPQLRATEMRALQPTVTRTPTTTATATARATDTGLVYPSPTLTVRATETWALPWLTPPPTRTPTTDISLPRLYVASMRLDPAQAKLKQPITFYVTFANNMDASANYAWFIYIYKEGQNNPFGQTLSDKTYVLPRGQMEQQALTTWQINGGQSCVNLTAQVMYKNSDGSVGTFVGADGKGYMYSFAACP